MVLLTVAHHQRFILPNTSRCPNCNNTILVVIVILTYDENTATYAKYIQQYAHIIATYVMHVWQRLIIIVCFWEHALANGIIFGFGSLVYGIFLALGMCSGRVVPQFDSKNGSNARRSTTPLFYTRTQ